MGINAKKVSKSQYLESLTPLRALFKQYHLFYLGHSGFCIDKSFGGQLSVQFALVLNCCLVIFENVHDMHVLCGRSDYY